MSTSAADLLVMAMRYEVEAREAIQALKDAGERDVWTTLLVQTTKTHDAMESDVRFAIDRYLGLKALAVEVRALVEEAARAHRD